MANSYRSDVAILNQGIRNANDGLSTLQIKDGALNNISTLLDRLATLATQASSTSNGADIAKLSDEYGKVIEEIDREAARRRPRARRGLLGVRQLRNDGGRRRDLAARSVRSDPALGLTRPASRPRRRRRRRSAR